MKKQLKSLICGIIIGAVVASGTTFAKTGAEMLEAWYSNVKIYLNGNQIDPKDANGNSVEPFIVNGTTYLPVRAVSEALGQDVYWDSETSSVYLTDKAQASSDDEILATHVAENFLKESTAYNLKEAARYTTDPYTVFESIPYQTKEELFSAYQSTIPEEFRKYDEEFTEYMEASFEAVMAKVSYEIVSVQPEGDHYKVHFRLTSVDSEKMNFETIMEELMANVDITGFMMNMIANGEITSNMGQEETADAIVPALLQELSKAVKNMKFETVTSEEEMILVKYGNTWLVDAVCLYE